MAKFIYFMSVSDNLRTVAWAGTVMFGLIIIGLLMGLAVSYDHVISKEGRERYWNFFKKIFFKFLYAFLISIILGVFVPSEKTIAAMYIIPGIAHSDQLRNMSENSLKILGEYTRQYLDDITDEKESEKKQEK